MQYLVCVIYENYKGVWDLLLVDIFCIIFRKVIPNAILCQLTKFQCHKFSCSRYQTKRVIKSLFRQLMTPNISRFIFDHLLKQWSTRKKAGKMEIQTRKLEYLENKKSFLDEITNIILQLFIGHHLVKL